MNLNPQIRLAIDPELILRQDVDRAVLLTRSSPLSDRSSIFIPIHPAEAVILCLLDGHHTLQEIGDMWANLSDKPRDVAYREVYRTMEICTTGRRGEDRIIMEATEDLLPLLRSYDPLHFIIPSDKVNLKERRLRIPYTVYYLPTLFCPHHCVYCYAKTSIHPESHPLEVQRLRELFAEARSLGVEAIQMSGGEVFTRPDIFQVIEAAREEDLAVDIPTKMWVSLDAACRFRDLGIRIIQVSLDSANPEVLDRMVGVKNHHRAMFTTLENLRAAKLQVRINTVLTPHNLHTVGHLLRYLGELGNVYRVSLTPYGRSLFRHDDGLFVDEQQLLIVEQTVATFRDRYPHMPVAVTGAPVKRPETEEQRQQAWKERAFCTGNRDGFIILPDGRVTVCEELYDHPAFLIGDLKRQSIMEMWRSSQAKALLYPDQNSVPDGPCKTCETFVECNSIRGRCWRDILKSYGADHPHWPDPKCPKAPRGNRLG